MNPRTGQMLEWAGLIAFLAAAVAVATGFLAIPRVVAGRSMEPALREGDRVLVDIWSYRYRSPRVGEVALLRAPGAETAVVKRVAPPPPELGGASTDRCWVLGDNPRESGDSRLFGAVRRNRFVGRVFWRYWPPSRVGPVPSPVGGGFKLPVR